MTRPIPCREANTRRVLTVDTTGEPAVDLAAELGVPLLLALLAADESRRPSLKIVTSSPDRAEDHPRHSLSPE